MAIIDFNNFPRQQILEEPRPSDPFPQDAFRRAMFDQNFVIQGDINPDGKIHRFGPKKENWYVFHGDGIPAGAFGSWKTGDSFDWCSKNEIQMTAEETYAYRVRLDAIKAEREAEQKKQREDAAREAEKVWREAQPLEAHPYLTRKGVKSHGLKIHRGAVLIPLTDTAGAVLSYQTIGPDGSKYFLQGGQKKGLFFRIPGEGKKIAIVEGYATGATVHELTGWETIVAFDAGNLEPVAKAIRQASPSAEIVIAADDDHATPGNPGHTKAKEAAGCIGATVLLPSFRDHTGKSDWNDLMQAEGMDEARRQLISKAKVGIDFSEWEYTRYTGPAPRQEYLVDGILARGCAILMAAAGGAGKGLVELDLALKVATDPDIMFPTGPDLNSPLTAFGGEIKVHGKVLGVFAEDDVNEIHRRLESLGRVPDHQIRLVPLPDIKGPMPLFVPGKSGPEVTKAWDEMVDQVKEFQPVLVILDPLAAFAMVDINADPCAAMFVMMNLAHLAKESGACVLVAHHMAKTKIRVSTAEDARVLVRGSTGIVDGVRGCYVFWRADDAETKQVCRLAGLEFELDRVWKGCLCKANYRGDKSIKTYLRNAFGLLEVVDDRIRGPKISEVRESRELLIAAIESAAATDNHFYHSGRNGIFERKYELPAELQQLSRHELEGIIQSLLSSKTIGKLSINGKTTPKLIVSRNK